MAYPHLKLTATNAMVDRKEDELDRNYHWTFREGIKRDHNMIYSSWLQSNRQAQLYNLVPNVVYFKEFHDIIESILSKSIVYIACAKDDPDQIFGYVVCELDPVTEEATAHWIYVKHPFRNAGIAQSLMTHLKETLSPTMVYFSTKTRRSGLNWDLCYSPFKLFKHCY